MSAFTESGVAPQIETRDAQGIAWSAARAALAAAGMAGGIPPWLLPVRLAWRQLRAEPTRLLPAIAGVMFASILVLMQLGFRAALFETATALPRALRGELFLIHPLTQALFRSEVIPRSRAMQALAVPGVDQAVPIYLTQLMWRNPISGTHRAVQIIAFDIATDAIGLDGVAAHAASLKTSDTILFDARSRPEFGDIAGLLARDGAVTGQLGGHEVDVAGMFNLGTSFAADGNVVMNDTTLWRIAPELRSDSMNLAAIRLKPDADPAQVQESLRRLLPRDVDILTSEELVQREHDYWDETTPIGVIFLFGTGIGLLVGVVIVYQILFTDVTNHLREYATLKAMGLTNRYLGGVVVGEAVILGALGFAPGLLASAALYQIAGDAAYLNLTLTVERSLWVMLIIIGMCVGAALLALRKAWRADPADVF